MPTQAQKTDRGAERELAETLDALHRRYLQTEDEHYVVLAIGLCPETPPRWATGACARLAVDADYRSSAKERGASVERADRQLVDRIVDLLGDRSNDKALVSVLVEEALQDVGPRQVRDPRREGRRASDPHRPARTLQDAYSLALREIEAGDLRTSIDEDEEHNRLAVSRWLRVEGPDGDLEGGVLVRVAPKPTGRNLIRMVKKQLLAQRDDALDHMLGRDTSSVPDSVTLPCDVSKDLPPDDPTPLQGTMKLVHAIPTTPSPPDKS